MNPASMRSAAAEFRAAGTDLSERRRSGVSKGPLIDIASAEHTGIAWDAEGAATISAFTTIAAIAQTVATPTRTSVAIATRWPMANRAWSQAPLSQPRS